MRKKRSNPLWAALDLAVAIQNKNEAVPNVSEIRRRFGASQAFFSKIIGVDLKLLERWELHLEEPKGPTLSLFRILDKYPETFHILLKAHEQITIIADI